MSHRQNSRISPSSVHCSYRFWTVTLSFCRERSASHEECYRFAGFWEPEGLPLLAGHHIVLQGIRKTSKCELGPRLYGCTESIACCSHPLIVLTTIQLLPYTLNPEPHTLNPKPQTLEPRTLSPKLHTPHLLMTRSPKSSSPTGWFAPSSPWPLGKFRSLGVRGLQVQEGLGCLWDLRFRV